MTTTLIVIAHPEPNSFTHAWAMTTKEACERLGNRVLISDLVVMGFDPVESVANYPAQYAEKPFDPLKVQDEASNAGDIPKDVLSELQKLREADRIVFHFPLWWFSPPAILKGWFERVLMHGETHSVDQRFDNGQFQGKKTLFCVSTGSNAEESAFNGKEGDVQMHLWPAAYTLKYLGFSVLHHRIIHGVHGYNRGDRLHAMEERLSQVLQSQFEFFENFDDQPVHLFNSDDDFDQDGRLKAGRPSHSAFIRHE